MCRTTTRPVSPDGPSPTGCTSNTSSLSSLLLNTLSSPSPATRPGVEACRECSVNRASPRTSAGDCLYPRNANSSALATLCGVRRWRDGHGVSGEQTRVWPRSPRCPTPTNVGLSGTTPPSVTAAPGCVSGAQGNTCQGEQLHGSRASVTPAHARPSRRQKTWAGQTREDRARALGVSRRPSLSGCSPTPSRSWRTLADRSRAASMPQRRGASVPYDSKCAALPRVHGHTLLRAPTTKRRRVGCCSSVRAPG